MGRAGAGSHRLYGRHRQGRKALIQTAAFWEFCHYGSEDVIVDAGAGDVAEIPIRRPALEYTEFSDATLRMPLYAIFEKYNRVIRES
ncbi:hypothetical protein ACGFZQ_08085 [Streptomyces sp. NPDC048254]|uniref:hypothetical protein n=1 Tax=Streptomyces sp. NPDC048254 TaxID=3365525 RepID=UPI00371BEAE3